MSDQVSNESAAAPISLEAVELELALQMQDVVARGFEDSVQSAVEAAGYQFLFQMPAGHGEDNQRIAAISTGTGDERRILLVHLASDGETLKVDSPEDDEDRFAGLAASYAGLMDCLQSPAAA